MKAVINFCAGDYGKSEKKAIESFPPAGAVFNLAVNKAKITFFIQPHALK